MTKTVATTSDVFRRRMRQVRDQHPMTRRQLSARLGELGYPIDPTTIEKIETGRKKAVPLDDVFAIAYALDVSPLFLLLPYADDEQVAVAPAVDPDSIWTLEPWLRGDDPLADQDRRRFFRELPPARLARLRDAALELEYGRPHPTGALEIREQMIAAGEAPPIEPTSPTPRWIEVLTKMGDDEALEAAGIDPAHFETWLREHVPEAKQAHVRALNVGHARLGLAARERAIDTLKLQMEAAADELGVPRKTRSKRKGKR